ncbi:MAG: helix-turn-helix domain-containing protein [Actinomycetota bacterium]|nr:helix-turn-helix domain-containing protein [Actinomycetota bacterium]
MTVPVDITDARLIKAFAHPLRLQILSLLDNRVASPKQIALELGTPLPNTAYHVRQLAALGLVELVRRTTRGGAIEHHYTAKVRPTVPDEVWATLPDIVRRAYSGSLLQSAIAQMAEAADSGGFERDDVHLTRTRGRVDEKGWNALSRELMRTLERLEKIVDEAEARLKKNPEAESFLAGAVMALFEAPSPSADGDGDGSAKAKPSGAGSRARAARGTARKPAS